MLPARALGGSQVRLSPLTFGSMRIHERPLDDGAWGRLLHESVDRGVTTFHSSREYESFPRFCSLLRGLEGRGLQHIVKLAEPGFGQASFDKERLVAQVDGYLSSLGAERLDVVQWMWRGDLKQEGLRLEGFQEARQVLLEAFRDLHRAGKVGAVAPFPYSAGFADLCIDSEFCEGLTVYLNPVELDLLPQIERAAAKGLGVIAIRPLAAGGALAAGMSPAACIESVLGRQGVTTAVVTYSSSGHLRELAEAVA